MIREWANHCLVLFTPSMRKRPSSGCPLRETAHQRIFCGCAMHGPRSTKAILSRYGVTYKLLVLESEGLFTLADHVPDFLPTPCKHESGSSQPELPLKHSSLDNMFASQVKGRINIVKPLGPAEPSAQF